MKLPLAVLAVEFGTGNVVVVGEQVLLVGCSLGILGKYVVGLDPAIHCGEAHVLVVEGGCSRLVDEMWTPELWL